MDKRRSLAKFGELHFNFFGKQPPITKQISSLVIELSECKVMDVAWAASRVLDDIDTYKTKAISRLRNLFLIENMLDLICTNYFARKTLALRKKRNIARLERFISRIAVVAGAKLSLKALSCLGQI